MSWASVRVLLPAIMLALDLGLLTYVMVRGRGAPTSGMFALLALCLAVWALGSLMLEGSTTAEAAVVWLRLNAYAVILFLVSFLLFAISFQGIHLSRRLLQAYVGTGFGLAVVTLGTRLVVESALPHSNGWAPQPGVLLLPLASLLLLPAYGTFLLARQYRHTADIMQRSRIVYVLLGLAGFLVAAMCEGLSFVGLQAPWIRMLASVSSLVCISYAAARTSVLETIVLARRGLAFLATAIIVGSLYASGLLLLRYIFNNRLQAVLYVSVGMTLLLFLISRSLRDSTERWITRLLWRSPHDAGLLLQEISRATASLLPPPQLTRLVLRRLAETLNASSGLFFVPEGPSGTLRPLARLGLEEAADALSLRADHPLVTHLARSGELRRGPAWAHAGATGRLWPNERRDLEAMHSALLMPLVARGAVVGLIVLGPRSDGKVYSVGDEATLSTLASHITVALDNARLFQDVAEEEERWHTLVDQVMAGVIVIDPSWRIVAMNPSASAITGFAPAEAVGRRLPDLLGADLCSDQGPLYRAVTSGQPVGEMELTFTGKKGRRDILLAVAPLGADHLLSFSDITHLKEVSRLKSDIVADVSHEFRAPLASIRAYAELLLEHKDRGDETARDRYVTYILHETDRLATLTSDLLDLSKLESGRFERQMIPVAMGEVIDDVVSMLQPQARERGVSVQVDVPTALPTISGDDRLLTMMVRNLLSNAIKYSLEGGCVNLEARAEDGRLVLVVADQGLGIAEEDLARIFEKFTRLTAARETGVSGTGLGLAMVKQAVDAHGGTITVTSRPQVGSRFVVTIPLAGTTPDAQHVVLDPAAPLAQWAEANGEAIDGPREATVPAAGLEDASPQWETSSLSGASMMRQGGVTHE